MPVNAYPYELPPLPYAYNALEPYIDAETMRYHHDQHYQTYINNLNEALSGFPKLQKLTLEQLLTRSYFMVGQEEHEKIMNNAGGVYNHMHFFNGLAPADAKGHQPEGALAAKIKGTFGSFETFQTEFTKLALGVFGSGWVCLAVTPMRRLKMYRLLNQATTLSDGARPVLLFDVWEHAYYLKHKNRRDAYLKDLWRVAVFQDGKKEKKVRVNTG